MLVYWRKCRNLLLICCYDRKVKAILTLWTLTGKLPRLLPAPSRLHLYDCPVAYVKCALARHYRQSAGDCLHNIMAN